MNCRSIPGKLCQHISLLGLIFAGLSGTAADAEDTPVRIGNPLLARFPVTGDARPRSIWDLHFHDNRLYLGHGDYWNDSGPTDVWTFQAGDTNFILEYTTAEEMIWDFVEYGDHLYIPGVDAMESWDFANLYIHNPAQSTNSGWTKLRTLPEGRHSFEVAVFQSNLYASITRSDYTGRTLVSTNKGQSWTTLLTQHSQLVVFNDFLFLEGDIDYVLTNQTPEVVTPDLLVYTLNTARKVRFRSGVLYSLFPRYQLTQSPLYYLTDEAILQSGSAVLVPAMATKNVRDIVVRGDICYVMTAEEVQTDEEYTGQVYAGTDLTNWTVATEFTVPGIPLSLEVMSNRFYVGIGSRFDGEDWSLLHGDEAGSIWEINPLPEIENLTIAENGSATLNVLSVPGFSYVIEESLGITNQNWSPLSSTSSIEAASTWVDTETPLPKARYYRIRN